MTSSHYVVEQKNKGLFLTGFFNKEVWKTSDRDKAFRKANKVDGVVRILVESTEVYELD